MTLFEEQNCNAVFYFALGTIFEIFTSFKELFRIFEKSSSVQEIFTKDHWTTVESL